MSEQLHSPMWYRVAGLRPALRQHARLHRHVYRDQVWHVLHDPASGRSHRFPARTWRVISLMDGQRTVSDVWDIAGEQMGDDVPTQGEVIQLLAQLHSADLLRVDTSPDVRELFERHERREKGRQKQRFGNPLALRFPLWDPDAFLTKTLRFVRPLFSWPGFVAWLLVVAAGGGLALMHWGELTQNFSDRLLTPANLLLVWLAFPVIKGLHELGHAYAVKVRGGEVHEIGIMLLVFMPVPYVDASHATAFPDKRQRMLVGAAGIGVEIFLAALAVLAWTAMEPGTMRAVAYNVMVIGGLSTALFNGNPLLRFDGYYVLADWLEIPNLGARANQYIGYLVKRYLWGVSEARSPVSARGERGWLASYAVTSFVYRILLTITIALYVLEEFPVIGALLVLQMVMTRGIVPLVRNARRLADDPGMHAQRHRVLTVGGSIAATVLLLVFAVPMPFATGTEGVAWPPRDAEVRAGAAGVVTRLLAPAGSTVRPGDPLLELGNPALPLTVAAREAEYREVAARYQAVLATDPLEAATIATQLASARASLEMARQQQAELVVRSRAAGRFVLPSPEDLPGRYLKQGDTVAYVADTQAGTIIAVVSQDDIGLVRERTRRIAVRLAEDPGQELTATIRRQVPAAGERLPSPALGSAGGGRFAVDPTDPDQTRTLDKVFQVELAIAEPMARLGGRAYILFEHGREPLGVQWYRRVRQLFLRRFDA